MKIYKIIFLLFSVILISCNNVSDEQAEDSANKDESVRRYNLEMQKENLAKKVVIHAILLH